MILLHNLTQQGDRKLSAYKCPIILSRQVMINSCIDYHRKYNRLEVTMSTLPPTDITNVSYNFALDNLEYEDLVVVLQRLSPAYRLAFNLFVIDGLSHQEIAEKLNISIGTSKSNLAKARMKLKSILQASYGIYPKSEGNGRK